MLNRKKGQSAFGLNALASAALAFVVTGLVLGFGLQIQGDVRDDQGYNVAGCNTTTTQGCGEDYLAINNSMNGNINIANRLPTIGTIIGAVLLIGILVGAFRGQLNA